MQNPRPDQPARHGLVLDLLERAVVAAFFGAMAWSFLRSWQETGSAISLILLISEGSVVVLVLIRRYALDVSTQPLDWIMALFGTVTPLLVRPTEGEALVSVLICVPVMLFGVGLQIAAKLTLRRSFGVVAANRGVKVEGPYRLVRHPMYTGYFLTQVGFLLTNPSAWNMAVYAIAFAFQIGRIMAEERVLSRDASYRAFAASVQYRLLPCIY